MADTEAGSESRESPSNVRPGGELSSFITTSLVNIKKDLKDLLGKHKRTFKGEQS